MSHLAVVRDRAPVETLQPGDEIWAGAWEEPRVVSQVESYDDGTHVVSYFKHGESCWENRAGRKNVANLANRLVERSIVPLKTGELVEVRRGELATAVRLRRQMERDQQRRFESH